MPTESRMIRIVWPAGKAGVFGLRWFGGWEYRTVLGQICRRESPANPWHQVTQDDLGFSDLLGVSGDGTVIAVKRPILSSLSFEGIVRSVGSWFVTTGRAAVSPRIVTGYELVVLRVK